MGPGALPTPGQHLSDFGWLESPGLHLTQTLACKLGAAVESGEKLGRKMRRYGCQGKAVNERLLRAQGMPTCSMVAPPTPWHHHLQYR